MRKAQEFSLQVKELVLLADMPIQPMDGEKISWEILVLLLE